MTIRAQRQRIIRNRFTETDSIELNAQNNHLGDGWIRMTLQSMAAHDVCNEIRCLAHFHFGISKICLWAIFLNRHYNSVRQRVCYSDVNKRIWMKIRKFTELNEEWELQHLDGKEWTISRTGYRFSVQAFSLFILLT